MKHGLICALACMAAIGCDDPNPTPAPAPAAYRVEATPTPLPTPSHTYSTPAKPLHNYDERDGVLYSYVAAVSEDDRKTGRAAGNVVTFAYLGEQNGKHTLANVRPDGSIAMTSTCNKPCRVITYADGQRIGYNEASIIGAAFADALSGKLKVAQHVTPPRPIGVAAATTPPAPPPPELPVWSRYEQRIIDAWLQANESCRGGTDHEAVQTACAERDGPASAELAKQNICYGREGEFGYQHHMHRCGPNSHRMTQ